MATAQAPSSRPVPAKHEAFVEAQLGRALGRIRTFDFLAGVFVFLIASLVYGLGLIALDAWLQLPSLIRQIAFALYFVAAIAYVASLVVKQIRWRLNPYYAAVHLERTLPGAKNSLVNWLDLRDRQLSPAIRGAVGSRAARDMSNAKIDEAIAGRGVRYLGGAVLALFLVQGVMLLVFGPGQFFSLWQRAFIPFTETSIITRTKLTIVEPQPHDAIVPIGQSVNFLVRVEGRVPKPDQADAIRLQFRYSQSEPYQERVLSRVTTDTEWGYLLPGSEVQNGFFYKITGGDFTTEEYQVTARSTPLITGFTVTYKHRPYLQQPDETKTDPNLVGWRGTEVTLLARTNRVVKDGRLIVEVPDKGTFKAEHVEGDDHALRFRFILVKPGSYHIYFSVEGETGGDSVPYTITIIPDNPPVVELTEPGTDVPVAANGALPLKGAAKDDYGITDMKLRLRMKGGPNLQSKPYRPGQYRYDDGGYPKEHDYQDFVALHQLALEDGKPHKVKEGDEIEYWLEATDNCDFPDPKGQVGQSKVYKIRVTKPTSEDQAQKDRNKAEKDQQKHEKQQSDKRKEEDKQRKDQAENGSSGEPKSNDPQSQRDKANEDIAKEFKQQIDEKKAENKPDSSSNKPGESKSQDKNGQGQNQQQNPGQNGNQKQDQNQGKNAESKPQPKEGGNGSGESKGGESKPQSKPGDKQEGKSKDQGQTGQQPKSNEGGGQGSEHGSSAQQPQAGKAAGENHQGENKTGQKPGDAKPQGQGGTRGTDTAGQTRTEKTPTGETTKGGGHPDGKQQGKPTNDDRPATGEAKPNGSAKGNSKGSPGDKPTTQVPSGQAKDKGADGQAGGPNGQQKPSKGPEAKNSGAARGDGKDQPKNADGGAGNASPERVAELAKQAQKGNAKDRADAEKQLQQIAKDAKDAKVREQAQQALKKAQEANKPGPQDSEPTPGSQTAGKTGPDGKPLPKTSDNGAGRDDSKTDEPKRPGSADGPGAKTDKTGDQNKTSAGDNSRGKPPSEKTDNRDPAQGAAGTTPGGGDQGSQGQPGTASSGPEAARAAAANAENKKRAAELQLEELMKKITPEMLKERNWTEEDLQRWHSAMKDAIKRDYDKEKMAKPQIGGAALPNSFRAGEKVTPGQAPDLQNMGKTAPPPEIRNAYQEFTQELSKLKRTK